MIYWFVVAADHIVGTLIALISLVVFGPLSMIRIALSSRARVAVMSAVGISTVGVAAFFAYGYFYPASVRPMAGGGGHRVQGGAVMPSVAPPQADDPRFAAGYAAGAGVQELRIDPATGCEFYVPLHGFGLVPRIGSNGRQICRGAG